MKIKFSLFLFFSSVMLSGCLVGHKIVYEIDVDKNQKGTAAITYTDIRSDAASEQEFMQDREYLFDYMSRSDKFILDMRKEGKEIISRELFMEKDKLNGKAVFRFDKISNVENLAYEDGFYFITLALDDSVVATNGEIIKSHNYKRILWDDKISKLKFEIYIEPSQDTKLRDLSKYYKK